MHMDVCFRMYLYVWATHSGAGTRQPVSVCVPMCMAHLGHVHVLAFFGGFTVSTLDTHVFPIQARLAILAWLSLWEWIIGQKSGLG